MTSLMTYEDGISSLLSHNNITVDNEKISITQAQGRILAEDIFSPINLPPFDNSAMDGIAYIYSEAFTNDIRNNNPLELQDISFAGDKQIKLHKNKAIEIMTGSPIPLNADTVTKVEDIQIENNKIIFTNPKQQQNSNIRLKGSDIAENNKALSQYTILNEAHITLLSALGYDKVKVLQKLDVSYFTTGNELLQPGKDIHNGQIYDSNSTLINLFLDRHNCTATSLGNVKDDLEQTKQIITQALQSTSAILISCGGVSAGKKDFIPQAIAELGGTVIFHKLKIRPGKPVFCATIQNKLFIGLAGNPISTAIGLRFILQPLLNNIFNLNDTSQSNGVLTNSYLKKHNFKMFVKANKFIDEQGRQQVQILQGQESYKIKPFSIANCWVSLDKDNHNYHKGEIIQVYEL